MKTQLINFTIPKELLEKIDKLAKKEARSRSEILREAVRRLLNEVEKRKSDFSQIRASAKKINLPENEAIRLIDKVRTTLTLNK